MLERYKDLIKDKKKSQRSLLLGNGASISISEKFKYSSIFERVKQSELLEKEEIRIFESLQKNCDFEEMMNKLYIAKYINVEMGIESEKVDRAYQNLRQALIKAIREIHNNQDELIEKADKEKCANFFNQFSNIFTLNYDLNLYWALIDFCGIVNFKDYFTYQSDNKISKELVFNYELINKEKSRSEVTKLFYLHGNLILIDNDGETVKNMVNQSDSLLLNKIIKSWEDGKRPLFISEGCSEIKEISIKKNPYLTYVYNVLFSEIRDTLVCYGWSFSEVDTHIIKKIKKNKNLKNLFVSIHDSGKNKSNITIQEERIKKLFNERKDLQIKFFGTSEINCYGILKS